MAKARDAKLMISNTLNCHVRNSPTAAKTTYPVRADIRPRVSSAIKPPAPPVSATAALNWALIAAATNRSGKIVLKADIDSFSVMLCPLRIAHY